MSRCQALAKEPARPHGWSHRFGQSNLSRFADTPQVTMAARKPLFAATLVVFCLLSLLCASPVLALTLDEITGLQSLLNLFPSLGSIPPSETYSDDGEWLGGSWSYENLPYICDSGDGWAIHGVKCSEGQINEIYMYAPLNSFAPAVLL